MSIKTVIEGKRGCGYRKKGGLYFISEGATGTCGKLTIALDVCPCCGSGIKFTRGFTWINTDLFKNEPCSDRAACGSCIANQSNTKLGLLWIGEKFYSTPGDFEKESRLQGVSRRINSVPRDFKVGETWIALAHIKAYRRFIDDKTVFSPGIFSFFRPSRIEYVITGSESEDEIAALEKRGFTLVDVVRDIDAQRALPL